MVEKILLSPARPSDPARSALTPNGHDRGLLAGHEVVGALAIGDPGSHRSSQFLLRPALVMIRAQLLTVAVHVLLPLFVGRIIVLLIIIVHRRRSVIHSGQLAMLGPVPAPGGTGDQFGRDVCQSGRLHSALPLGGRLHHHLDNLRGRLKAKRLGNNP